MSSMSKKKYLGKIVRNKNYFDFDILAVEQQGRITSTTLEKESNNSVYHLHIVDVFQSEALDNNHFDVENIKKETETYYKDHKDDLLSVSYDLQNRKAHFQYIPLKDISVENKELLKKIKFNSKVDQLIENVKKVRPEYSSNEILNIAICMFQSFLTVFSGDPGCGKTSICNIMAEAMGLKTKGKYTAVSVERGWTSKSDFIGFANPMTGKLVINNHALYEALVELDNDNPTLILLDEANLSPMEYYWSDFMKVCDSSKEEGDPDAYIHLGGNTKDTDGNESDICIRKTCHFVATINNDETTETLSPRLIDRSFVITLPSPKYDRDSTDFSDFWEIGNGNDQKVDSVEMTWKDIETIFLPDNEGADEWNEKDKDILMSIVKELHELGIVVSKRSQIAINRYYSVASALFEEENYDGAEEDTIAPSRIALDFAVSQKILPMINNYWQDDEAKQHLFNLSKIFQLNHMDRSFSILNQIVEDGENQMNMGFYTFF